MNERAKITANHLSRQVIVYLRQSSAAQVENNRESTDRQYALAAKARELGWPADRIVVIDEDLGLSGSGFVARSGFARLTAEVACVMPAQHASQPSMLFARWRVHPTFQLLPQFPQLADQASALGFAVDHEPPIQGLSAIVRKAQEIERLWPPFAPSPTVSPSQPSAHHYPRLVFVQSKTQLGQSFRQGCRHPIRIRAPLEGQQEVVGIAHQPHRAGRRATHPLQDP